MANIDKIAIGGAEMRPPVDVCRDHFPNSRNWQEPWIEPQVYVTQNQDINLDISSWYVDHKNNVLSITLKNEESSIHGIVVPPRVNLDLSKVKDIINEILK
ncbi:hypothetical protein VPFG_00131 [Vibrio phage nt-1]|uniref:Uncharacterized protein n=1 Tax=Vibrio phage nt-1 TaxID=115992 RepID=R9TGB6_9CAUD|nr:hypothetical protein VPFG_00131 [Vibrio phage nt-1]AGN30133.1 hypothetical protein VPFG_00131 [Vibrio phage nt-1]